jgi:hypothetical protein
MIEFMAAACLSFSIGCAALSYPCNGVPQTSTASAIEARLNSKADFLPTAESPLDQLIQIATHYKIPMAIEWINRLDEARGPVLPDATNTVRELINAILRMQRVQYQLVVRNGILHINCPSMVFDVQNPLNLRISHFAVKKENLFDAEADLGVKIDMALHPMEYKDGYISDNGYPPGHVFEVANITFDVQDLNVRDILDRIAVGNGNALWVVRLDYEAVLDATNPKLLNSRLPRRSAGLPGPTRTETPIESTENEPPPFYWTFIPLTKPKDNSGIDIGKRIFGKRIYTGPKTRNCNDSSKTKP